MATAHSRGRRARERQILAVSLASSLTFLLLRGGFGFAAFLGGRFLASCRRSATCRLLLPTESPVPTARILLAGADSCNTHDLIPFLFLAAYSARHINRRLRTRDTPLRCSETTWSSPSIVDGQVPPPSSASETNSENTGSIVV